MGYHLLYFGGLSTFSDSVWIPRVDIPYMDDLGIKKLVADHDSEVSTRADKKRATCPLGPWGEDVQLDWLESRRS